MAGYRLYFLSDEHIQDAVAFECDSHEDPIKTVREHADGRVMELWSGARMLRRFPAEGEPPGPDRHSAGWILSQAFQRAVGLTH